MDVDLLYNSVKTKSQTVGEKLLIRCGRESHARPKGPLEPLMIWGSEKLLIRCGRESPAEGALGALMSWGPEKLPIRCGKESQQSGPLGLQLSSPGELSLKLTIFTFFMYLRIKVV